MVQARKMNPILIANLIFQRGDRDSEFLRHLHVRLPEVHGLHQPGEGEAGKKWGNEIGNI